RWIGDSVPLDDLPRFTSRFAYFPGGLTRERMVDWGTSLIGSPETDTAGARDDRARPARLPGGHVQLRGARARSGHPVARALRDPRHARARRRAGRRLDEGGP